MIHYPTKFPSTKDKHKTYEKTRAVCKRSQINLHFVPIRRVNLLKVWYPLIKGDCYTNIIIFDKH